MRGVFLPLTHLGLHFVGGVLSFIIGFTWGLSAQPATISWSDSGISDSGWFDTAWVDSGWFDTADTAIFDTSDTADTGGYDEYR